MLFFSTAGSRLATPRPPNIRASRKRALSSSPYSFSYSDSFDINSMIRFSPNSLGTSFGGQAGLPGSPGHSMSTAMAAAAAAVAHQQQQQQMSTMRSLGSGSGGLTALSGSSPFLPFFFFFFSHFFPVSSPLLSSVFLHSSSSDLMIISLLLFGVMVAFIDCCRFLRTLGCCRTPEPGGCPVGSVCCFFVVPRCDAVGRRASSRTTKRRRRCCRRVSSRRRRSVGSRVPVCFSECVCLLLVFLPPPPPPPGGGGVALFFSSPRHARRVSLCFSRHDCCGHESCLPAPPHADRLASRVADTAVSAHHRTWLSGCRLSTAPTAAAAAAPSPPPASGRRRGRRQRDGENASSNRNL